MTDMTDNNTDDDNNDMETVYSENDYCPICGQLAIGPKKHLCPEEILDEICKQESEDIEYYYYDDDKEYGEKLDDADFIMNYYENEYDEDEEDLF